MPRNRVIYQSEGLYVSSGSASTTSGHHYQLDRVQSANYNFNVARQDINQFGELARIDSIVLESPTVSLDFSYYLTDGANELALGFNVTTGTATSGVQFASGQLVDLSGKNFYIVTTADGRDLNSESTLSGTPAIGIGNAYLTDYTVDLSVGNIPTISVSMEGSNMNAFTFGAGNSGASGANAGINLTSGTKLGTTVSLISPNSSTGTTIINALRPGDVTVSFGGFTGSGSFADLTATGGLHIQSASLSLPLGRTPIERLGSKFAYARTVDFPVVATLSVNGIQQDAITSGNLADMIDNTLRTDVTITVNQPGTTNAAVRYTMKRAQLDSTSFSSSIGANKTVDLTFTTQIGGINDAANGIQMSGCYSGAAIFL